MLSMSTGLVEVLQQMYPLYRIEGMPTPDLSAFNGWTWTDESIRSLYVDLAQPFPDGYIYVSRNARNQTLIQIREM